MSVELKVTGIGDELAVIIPKEMVAELKIRDGDTVFLTKDSTDTPTSAQDERIRRQMEIAERVMRENQTLLHKLAQ